LLYLNHGLFMTIILSKNEHRLTIIGIILILLLLFIGAPVLNLILFKILGLSESTEGSFFISRIFYWLCALLAWYYSIKIEKRPFILWQDQKHKFWIYVVSFIAMYFILAFSLLILKSILSLSKFSNESPNLSHTIAILRGNKLLLIFTALTAGVVEELIFRGYLQPRFELIFKNKWASILIASFLFGLLHYRYGTVVNVLGPFLIGLVFAIYYQVYRNLKFLMLFHFLWDLLALLMQFRVPHK
jgi:membrane protease YdiL (CAAX protease family)